MSLNPAEYQQPSIQRCSIEREKVASGLVWTGLQVNICHLEESFADESFSMSQEDNWESRLRLTTGRAQAHTQQNGVGLVGRQHQLLAQRFWPLQSPDWNSFHFNSWTPIKEKTCKQATATQMGSRKDFVREVCKTFRHWLERVIATKGDHIK